jgi:GSH-dependent disulfide-bond oxidoreductase
VDDDHQNNDTSDKTPNTRKENCMIVVYGKASSPYCQKVTMMLDAIALPYAFRTPAIGGGDAVSAELLALNPNATVPVMLDQDNGIAVFESAAILLYLAEKTGRLLPAELPRRAEVYQWLMFEAATMGAVAGELHHYICVAQEDVPYAQARNQSRFLRCAAILEKQLDGRDYLCGTLSIADMAIYPWVSLLEDFTSTPLSTYPHLSGWLTRMHQGTPQTPPRRSEQVAETSC